MAQSWRLPASGRKAERSEFAFLLRLLELGRNRLACLSSLGLFCRFLGGTFDFINLGRFTIAAVLATTFVKHELQVLDLTVSTHEMQLLLQ